MSTPSVHYLSPYSQQQPFVVRSGLEPLTNMVTFIRHSLSQLSYLTKAMGLTISTPAPRVRETKSLVALPVVCIKEQY